MFRTMSKPMDGGKIVNLDADTVAVHLSHQSNDPATFDSFVMVPSFWLQEAPKLLRAGRAILHEVDDEWRWIKKNAGSAPIRHRALISLQASMLAACAVECALKGAILAKEPMSSLSSNPGKLPKELAVKPSHDLAALAGFAGVTGATDDEKAVLTHGRSLIAWLGRYHLPTSAAEWKDAMSARPFEVWNACLSLTLQCSELIWSRHHARGEVQGELRAVVTKNRDEIIEWSQVGGWNV